MNRLLLCIEIVDEEVSTKRARRVQAKSKYLRNEAECLQKSEARASKIKVSTK